MPFNRICETCGTPFIAQGSRARFCAPCARKRANEQRSGYQKKRIAKKRAEEGTKEEERFFADSPENIETCLSCTRAVCALERGDKCPELKGK